MLANRADYLLRHLWKVGQRVRRYTSPARGSVTETNRHHIKVKWDSGQTSYFPHGDDADVQADPPGPDQKRL